MSIKEVVKRGWIGVGVLVLTVVAWMSSCGACLPPPRSPAIELRDATEGAHRAAVAELEKRIELARGGVAAAPAARQALAGVDLARLVEAVRQYAAAVRAGNYQAGLVGALREAARQYEAVRLALAPYVQLPTLPPVVQELLLVEECE